MTETTTVARTDGLLRRAVLHDLLRRHAARTPHRAAIVHHATSAGRTEISYAELDRRANRIAHRWRALGVGRGTVVAALAGPSPSIVVAYYAALRCGATFTAFNPAAASGELAVQIALARPAVLVHDAEQVSKLTEIRGGSATPDSFPRLEPITDLTGAPGEPDDEPDAQACEDDVALLVWTSGTESRPKAVMLTHRAFMVATTVSWLLEGYLRPTDRFMLLAPMHTTAGLGTITNIVSSGATMVVADATDAATVLRVIETEQVTNMSQTPAFYRRLINAPEFAPLRLASLEQCHTYGGLAQAEVFERISSAVPGMTWATYWGQSELTQLGALGWFRTVADIPRGDVRWIGKPTVHLDVRVVDDQDRDTDVGELIVRSPAVMAGYLGDPAATDAALRGGWLRTGDIVGTDDDRNLYFFDRRKDMVKTGGMNVSSLEVEHALSSHPAVAEAAVVGLPDPEWSEAVTAFVVLRPEAIAAPDELRAHCRRVLTAYKVPKAVHVVGDLPRDAQGKVRKRVLRDGGACR